MFLAASSRGLLLCILAAFLGYAGLRTAEDGAALIRGFHSFAAPGQALGAASARGGGSDAPLQLIQIAKGKRKQTYVGLGMPLAAVCSLSAADPNLHRGSSLFKTLALRLLQLPDSRLHPPS